MQSSARFMVRVLWSEELTRQKASQINGNFQARNHAELPMSRLNRVILYSVCVVELEDLGEGDAWRNAPPESRQQLRAAIMGVPWSGMSSFIPPNGGLARERPSKAIGGRLNELHGRHGMAGGKNAHQPCGPRSTKWTLPTGAFVSCGQGS